MQAQRGELTCPPFFLADGIVRAMNRVRRACATERLLAMRKHVLLCVIVLSSVLNGQEVDTLSVRFNTDTHHPENQALERLTILDPALRLNDFTQTYSPFDVGLPSLDRLPANSLFLDELRYRFVQGRNPISLLLGNERDNVTVEPIVGYKVFADNDGERFSRRTNGLKLFGKLGEHVAFFASAVDNLERGKITDRKKELERTNGFVISSSKPANGFDFDEAQLQIGFRWGGAQLFFEKLRSRWGYGESGNLVLSEKAPSFPQARLVVQISKNLKFTYLLASLYSDLIDTEESYRDATSGYFRTVYRSKYLASHVLEYAPVSSLNIVLGESMVFSDRFQAVYLLPLMFFRMAEHQNRNTDNAQLFAGIRYTFPTVCSLYGTLFIDDMNSDMIFSEQNTNIIAWTLGGKFIDVGWNNLDCTLEYTRLNPWVYTHEFQAATYESDGYVLGHWLGQNADVLSASVQYRRWRPLWLTFYAQKLRKGVLGPPEVHYSQPWAQKFLNGPVFRQTQIGLKTRWEMYRYLFLSAEVAIWDQNDDLVNRYPSYTNKAFFNVGISYNLFELP